MSAVMSARPRVTLPASKTQPRTLTLDVAGASLFAFVSVQYGSRHFEILSTRADLTDCQIIVYGTGPCLFMGAVTLPLLSVEVERITAAIQIEVKS